MTGLLLLLVFMAALNTLSVLICVAFKSIGELEVSRVVDWFYTAGVGVWAACLLWG